jgi:hypothetical protein
MNPMHVIGLVSGLGYVAVFGYLGVYRRLRNVRAGLDRLPW